MVKLSPRKWTEVAVGVFMTEFQVSSVPGNALKYSWIVKSGAIPKTTGWKCSTQEEVSSGLMEEGLLIHGSASGAEYYSRVKKWIKGQDLEVNNQASELGWPLRSKTHRSVLEAAASGVMEATGGIAWRDQCRCKLVNAELSAWWGCTLGGCGSLSLELRGSC